MRALGIEQREKIRKALTISNTGDCGGTSALTRLIRQLHQALLLFAIRHEGVFGLLERSKDRLFVDGHDFVAAGSGASEPRPRAAQIEAGPTQRRCHGPCARVGAAEQAPAARQEPEETRDGDARKELRGGNTLARGRGRDIPFRRAYVRTPLQQRPRVAERQGLCDRYVRSRNEIHGELAGAPACQHGEPMAARRNCGSERREARLDRRHARRGARDVLLFARACIAPDLGQPQRFLLVCEAAFGHRDLLLKSPELKVVTRHFRRHAHTHIVERRRKAVGGG